LQQHGLASGQGDSEYSDDSCPDLLAQSDDSCPDLLPQSDDDSLRDLLPCATAAEDYGHAPSHGLMLLNLPAASSTYRPGTQQQQQPASSVGAAGPPQGLAAAAGAAAAATAAAMADSDDASDVSDDVSMPDLGASNTDVD
jgi:hypothetical protein